ncbi:MAG: flagellar biosynthesis protein FlhA [Polyangiales bacterium]
MLSRAKALRGSRADVAFALFVIAVVGLLVVPVPPPVLDVLLATSLASAVVVLLVVLYINEALAIATFPTLLLLTTLYRLALNVSTSRMILLRADAGEVIKAFGNFVVRGNYLVGAIVFAILTIIQFIVIAKGSERVAEVAARFALDAMPGKQMAIDAELRAGSIDAAEARRRRRSLARESQFYGAMDGAMKFVKGDVIAGLIITAVNILGGLAVGVLQRDMPAADALKKYGLLTIGDGLVTQIPALVTSTAAGLLVTRVASEEADTSLGTEMGRQLFGNARALFAAAGFVGLLAVVPGLPGVPFLLIAVVLFVAGQRRVANETRERREDARPDKPQSKSGGPAFVPMIVPWSVDLGPGFAALLEEDEGLRARISGLRQEVFHLLGLPVPAPRIAIASDLPEFAAVISVREVPVELVKPNADLAAQADTVVDAAKLALTKRAHELLGIGETQLLLDALEEVNPALVRQLVPKPVSVTVLSEVLRRLLEERVSIRDLRTILEGIAPLAATDKDPVNLAEMARVSLRRALTHRWTGGARTLACYTVDKLLEDQVRNSVTRVGGGTFLALQPSVAKELVETIVQTIAAVPQGAGEPVVIVVNGDVRRFFRRLLDTTMPDAVVLGYNELEDALQLSPRAHVAPR